MYLLVYTNSLLSTYMSRCQDYPRPIYIYYRKCSGSHILTASCILPSLPYLHSHILTDIIPHQLEFTIAGIYYLKCALPTLRLIDTDSVLQTSFPTDWNLPLQEFTLPSHTETYTY